MGIFENLGNVPPAAAGKDSPFTSPRSFCQPGKSIAQMPPYTHKNGDGLPERPV